MDERFVAEDLDELDACSERRLSVRAPTLGDGQVLGTDPDHELASLAGDQAGGTMTEVSRKGEPLRTEREHELSCGPRNLGLVQVHRRRADERGDEQVGGGLVEVQRRGQLVEGGGAVGRVPARRTATRSPIVIASVWSCVT